MPSVTAAEGAPDRDEALDLVSIHERHAQFIWVTLARMGVRDVDLEDVSQEVFVVVHQRLHTFDGSSRITTWLYGVCVRVASGWRRRAWRRREAPVAIVPDPRGEGPDGPEEAAMAAQARARLQALLDGLDVEKRAAFVMFELEEMTCDEIAALTGVPVGTVYSRLHAARKAVEQATQRLWARGRLGGVP
ncbi:MAG: sigma-70 family RNA polymerase sigma factor [Polyangiales bacterium]